MKEKDENKFIFKNKTHLQRPEIQIQKEKKRRMNINFQIKNVFTEVSMDSALSFFYFYVFHFIKNRIDCVECILYEK